MNTHTHQNLSLILVALSWDLSLLIPSYFSSFICNYGTFNFYFYFMVEGYNVYVTIELFPYIDIMMAESTMNSLDQDMQGPPGINTFLNLFNH